MNVINIVKEGLFWVALMAGVSIIVIGALWVIDAAFKRIIIYYKIYDDFIQFMMAKRRKKTIRPSRQ